MPPGTPQSEHDRLDKLGSKIILSESILDEAELETTTLGRKFGMMDVPSCDDMDVVTGQATIGLELMRQVNTRGLKAIFCNASDSDTLLGLGMLFRMVLPNVQVIGVELKDGRNHDEGGDECSMAAASSSSSSPSTSSPSTSSTSCPISTKSSRSSYLVSPSVSELCRAHIHGIIQVTMAEAFGAVRTIFDSKVSPLTYSWFLLLFERPTESQVQVSYQNQHLH